MAYLAAQVSNCLVAHHESGREPGQKPGYEHRVRSQPPSRTTAATDLTLECTVQSLPGKSGLCARVSYYFPTQTPVLLDRIFSDVEALNQRLVSSQVFVFQELDGGCASQCFGQPTYYLRMDTVQAGQMNDQNASVLLDNVTQDISTLLKYFRENGDSSPQRP